MAKEKQREIQQTSKREHFQPCGTDIDGDANHGGSSCIGGMRIFMRIEKRWNTERQRLEPPYGGQPQRVAMECQCLLDWRSRNLKTA